MVDSTLSVSVGRGRRAARASRELSCRATAGDLAELLRKIGHGDDPWWSPHTWTTLARREEHWRGTHAIVVDVDYHADNGEHAPLPDDVRERLVDVPLPGNLMHVTPRGLRVVFLLAAPVTDGELYARARDAAFRLVASALEEGGVAACREGKRWCSGLAVDAAASDRARFYWCASGTVCGVPRRAPVEVLGEQPWAAEALAAHAAEPDPEPEPRQQSHNGRAEGERTDSLFEDAVSRWNREHHQDWPRPGNGECPACGHRECFGALPDNPERWACFSSNHEADSRGCGIQGARCWHGDALDLEAHRRGLSRREVLEQDKYLRPRQQQGVEEGEPERRDRPQIRLGLREAPIVDAAIRAINDGARGELFQRGGILVHLVRQPVEPGRPRRVRRPTGAPFIRTLSVDRLHELLTEVADWLTPVRVKGGGYKWAATHAPPFVARRILARAAWPFQVLVGLTEVPVLRADGTILATPGYDTESGLFFHAGGVTFPAAPDSPTHDDARRALDALEDVLDDFPFVSPADRAVAIAGILGPFARFAIEGPVPLIAFGASAPGTGKSLLASIVATLASGRPMSAITPSGDEEERRFRSSCG